METALSIGYFKVLMGFFFQVSVFVSFLAPGMITGERVGNSLLFR